MKFFKRQALPQYTDVLAESWLVANPWQTSVSTGVVSSGESEWLLFVPTVSAPGDLTNCVSASLTFLSEEQNTLVPANTPVLVGPRVRPYIVCFPPETVLFGVVIRPWSLGQLLDDRADRAFNRFLLDHPLRPPEELFSRTPAELETRAVHQILIELQEWFVSRVRDRHCGSISLARQVIAAFDDAAGMLPVADIASQIERSHSMLCRRFKEHVGMTAKRYARIRRANAALRAIEAGRRNNGAEMAAYFGYYDQPHMIRELRELTGSSPQVWRDARERQKSIWPFSAWDYLGFEPRNG
ncbi:MAG: helix-turn-helix transcriptional regulator [Gammaproteobacteria bacterium]|nr:helix-turn-helix transcriptional regulator [Gammaproteobacteria bacterium]